MRSNKPTSWWGAQELRQRLTWLTLLRAVGTTVLFVLLVVRALAERHGELSEAQSFTFGLVVVAYVATLANGLLLRQGSIGPVAAWGQVVLDCFLAGGLVSLTGGPESPFAVMFSVASVGAAFLLGRRGAAISVVLSVLAWGVVGFLRPSIAHQVLSVGTQLAAQGIVAVLAAYVAEQLQLTGGKLTASEADLRRLQGLQNAIVEAMPSGLLTCDGQGRISFTNRVADQILAQGTGEALGKSLNDLMPGVAATGRHRRRTELTISPGGVNKSLGLTTAPLDNVEAGGLLVVFQDLTELRRVEAELRTFDRLAALGRTAAQLAHEVRNPLASMRGAAQMLASEQTDPSHSKLAGLIIREADRLAALVDEFLVVARPKPPQLQSTALDALIGETLTMLSADPMIRAVNLEQHLEPTTADVEPAQIQQVVLNLVRNAAEAAGPNGTIRVGVSAEPAATISVWDSAGSLSDEAQRHLFEPFFTTKPGGTGLGLSMAMTIVRAHGGTIRVTSSREQGTLFKVVFQPAASEV